VTDKEKILYLLFLRAQREIQAGRVIKLEDRGKKMKVTFDAIKWKKAFTLTPAQMNRILELLMHGIKARTPVDTGRLKSSIRKKITGTNKGEVYIEGKRNNEVAKYNHFGTEAHFVAPIRAKALHWVMGGKDYYSKGHMVSGIIGTEFFKPTGQELTKVRNLLNQYFKQNLGVTTLQGKF
jgi:hypothetical protein